MNQAGLHGLCLHCTQHIAGNDTSTGNYAKGSGKIITKCKAKQR